MIDFGDLDQVYGQPEGANSLGRWMERLRLPPTR
jgi:hypothetical protein